MNKKNTPPVNSAKIDGKKDATSKEKIKNTKDTTKKTSKSNNKSKKNVGFLAILILLGLVSASGYLIYSHEVKFKQQITDLKSQVHQLSVANNSFVKTKSLKALTNQLKELQQNNKQLTNEVNVQEKNINQQQQLITTLQSKVNDININNQIPQTSVQPTNWLLAESDYLLNNALHKLIIDDDVETAIALLQVADETLSKINDPQVITVRSAINEDLKQLFAVNNIDQDAIMQHLSLLANQIDNLMILGIGNSDEKNNDVSDSIDDWEKNLSKNIDNFFDKFIKVTKKNADNKELLAPNQDIYLRENIRLRLQIAIMAVPRQQNTLYQQSLEMVATWIRSYFDTTNPEVQQYLATLDELSQQSIYINIPTQLKSLELLDRLLHKTPKKLQKIELATDKSLKNEEETKAEIKASEVTTLEAKDSSENGKEEDASLENKQDLQPVVTEDK